MKVIVKKLQGVECAIDVEPDMYIGDFKTLIAKSMDIPEDEQKLVLNGKTLSDDHIIKHYPSIKEGTKINLIVKKPESLKEAIHKLFKKHYREPDATNITLKFLEIIQTKFNALSLDDIENLALCSANIENSKSE